MNAFCVKCGAHVHVDTINAECPRCHFDTVVADEISEIELPVDQTLGVWYDLACALEGKNGYGGDVAEIYAYRLLPPGPRHPLSDLPEEDQARIAAANLTSILRQFVERHEDTEIGIEEGPREFRFFDPREEAVPPFLHRLHLRVVQDKFVRAAFSRELRALFDRAHEIDTKLPQPNFMAWACATKDFLIALGLEWDAARETYVIKETR